MTALLRTTTVGKIPTRVKDRLVMQPFVQRLLLPFGREIRGKKWVFILGCYNSGTTLLAEMLQRHPEFSGLPNEGAFLTDALPYPERRGWPRMWAQCPDPLRVRADDFARARRIRKHWSLWMRGDGDWVVEKSISNVLRVDFLATTFEDAHFIHIVRNGYAVAAGIRKKANLRRWKNPEGYTEYPIELCAEQWSETEREIRRSLHFPDRIKTISYEELTEAPARVMDRVWEDLGAPAHQEPGLWDDLQVHEVRSEVRNMNAGSLRGLSDEDRAAIRRVSGDELDWYGYTPDA